MPHIGCVTSILPLCDACLGSRQVLQALLQLASLLLIAGLQRLQLTLDPCHMLGMRRVAGLFCPQLCPVSSAQRQHYTSASPAAHQAADL